MTVLEDGHQIPSDKFERVLLLQNTMSACATNRSEPQDNGVYVAIRRSFVQDAAVRERLPEAVRVCRSLEHFWEFIKPKYGTYAERREYLRREFEPLLSHLEGMSTNPVDDLLDDVLEDFSAEAVQKLWEKAIESRERDPEAAITLARSLIESVCKHILDEAGEEYGSGDQLYRRATALMNLAPDQQSEQSFKQLLGACNSIVGSLNVIRNRFGDAHGRSSSDTEPSPRHAELAVNVAGSLAMFLVKTRLEEGRR